MKPALYEGLKNVFPRYLLTHNLEFKVTGCISLHPEGKIGLKTLLTYFKLRISQNYTLKGIHQRLTPSTKENKSEKNYFNP